MQNNSLLQNPSMDDMGGLRGVQKEFTAQANDHNHSKIFNSFHSIFSLSKRRLFSTAWVKLAKSLVSILDFTQSSRSFGSVMDLGTRILAMYNISLQKHINILYCMTCNVLYNNTQMNEGGGMNEWKENYF